MNTKSPLHLRSLGAILGLALTTLGAHAGVTMQLDRNDIGSDETAELTVNAAGNGGDSITPPSVAGLQFNAVSQSSQIEIINGSASSTASITYEVTPQGPGTYTIPSSDPNGAKLTLHVHAGASGGSSRSFAANPATSAPSAPNLPAPAIAGANAPSDVHMLANGAGFLRMQMPKHDLYVGESVPVDIQLGLRAGMVASLNGLPALSVDAFTMNNLTDKPEQTQTYINGEPYTLLTWHSLLAAVKPGDFSLGLQAPVTVQVRAARTPGNDDDPFSDPFFQNFFGGRVTQKEINLASDPTAIKVLPLPTANQPANFSGAVGNFAVSSEINPASGTVGDPLTLRLKVVGTGAFDRVENSMLSSSDAWKTYRATGKFTPSDSVGYHGEKDFEQTVIPQRAGHQTVPPIAFTYFNPESRQYETLYTQPAAIDIAPGSNPVASTASNAAPGQAPAAAAPATPANGLRPDMTETGMAVRTLRPLYFQPGFVASQAVLALAFIGAGFWMRRSAQIATDPARIKRSRELKAVDGFLTQMDSAAKSRDAYVFFFSARQALQHALASRWKMTPGAVTLAEVDAHMSDEGENVRRVFALADELAYSGHAAIDTDFNSWKQAVHHLIKQTV